MISGGTIIQITEIANAAVNQDGLVYRDTHLDESVLAKDHTIVNNFVVLVTEVVTAQDTFNAVEIITEIIKVKDKVDAQHINGLRETVNSIDLISLVVDWHTSVIEQTVPQNNFAQLKFETDRVEFQTDWAAEVDEITNGTEITDANYVVLYGLVTDIAEIYFAPGVFIDFTDPTNRAKFHDAQLRPVFLGNDGSLPNGQIPLLYLTLAGTDLNPNDFLTNLTGNGAFSLINGNNYGTAPTSPTD